MWPQTLIYILFSINIIVSSTADEQADTTLNDFRHKNQCTYACNNYLKIDVDNVTDISIDKVVVDAIYTYATSTVKIAIMRRQKFWIREVRNWGAKPISYGLKTLLPDKGEAITWFENKKCKIGNLCPPNGDCWGSTSTACNSDIATTWVKERTFQFKGIQWSTSFHETCTMDWECKYLEKDAPIHYDSEGNRFIVVDDDKVKIVSSEPEQIFNFKDFLVYVDKVPKEFQIHKKLSCFKYKKDLMCEDTSGAFLLFESGTKCTVLGDAKYCLKEGEFNRVRDFGANKYASVSDLNQVRDAFIVNQERNNYNFHIMNVKFRRIQEFIMEIVSTLSSGNPNILNGILKGNYFSRHLENGVFEICPCKNPINCKIKEFHHPTIKFCASGIKWKVLRPFKLEESIDYVIDDKFKFQGKDIHVEESLIEDDLKNGDFDETHDSPSIWTTLTNGFSLFGSINNLLLYIALGLSIFNFVRR